MSMITAADNSAVPFSQRLCLTPEQAAQYVGLGRTSVFELVKTGELESLKIGSRRLVVRASADAFIERRRSAQ